MLTSPRLCPSAQRSGRTLFCVGRSLLRACRAVWLFIVTRPDSATVSVPAASLNGNRCKILGVLQKQATETLQPSNKINGLELALQRAWVDAAARRAKRDSLGAMLIVVRERLVIHQAWCLTQLRSPF